jgi:hypothetical protein
MMTGTSGGLAITTSRPDPRRSRRSTTAATRRFFFQRVETFVGGFRGHDREAVHFEKLDQRTSNGHIVFDDEHETRGILGHAGQV